jgi:hypothetical protein
VEPGEPRSLSHARPPSDRDALAGSETRRRIAGGIGCGRGRRTVQWHHPAADGGSPDLTAPFDGTQIGSFTGLTDSQGRFGRWRGTTPQRAVIIEAVYLDVVLLKWQARLAKKH